MSEIVNLIEENPDIHKYVDAVDIVCKHLDRDLSFVFQIWDREVPETKFKKVLIFTSDEGHGIPNQVKDDSVVHIFKQYAPMKNPHYVESVLDVDKVSYLPLCELKGFENENIPMLDRELDWCFMGQLDPFARRDFAGMATALDKEQYKHVLHFYQGWNNGVERSEYSKVMNSSKIAFVPNGSLSRESFRFYEAMKCGCAVISVEQPRIDMYDHAPFIRVKDWNQAYDIFHSLIEEKDMLQQLSANSLKWYNDYCSAESIAKYMMEKL